MPDDTFSSDANGNSGDVPSEGTGTLRRIAIVAREPKAADALWGAVEKRFRQKERLAVLRSAAAEADVGVYVLAAEDFADNRAARAKMDEIAKDPAPRKFLIEPYSLSNKQERERLTALLAAFAGRAGVVKLDADAIANQAKAIARALKSEIPHDKPVREPKPEKPAVSDAERAARKAARQRAKEAAKKEKGVPGAGKARPAKEERKKAKTKTRPQRARATSDAAAKARKKEAKRRAKEALKTRKRPEPTPEDLAAKAARKAGKAKAKESKRSKKAQPTAAELAAKKARKAEKSKAKDVKKQKPAPKDLAAKKADKARDAKRRTPVTSPEDIAAKAARKAQKAKAKKAKKQKPEPAAEDLAVRAARKAEKLKAKEAKKSGPTPEELAAKEARKAQKAKAKESKKQKPEPTAEEIAARALKKEAKRQAKEAKKPEPAPEELAAKEARKAQKAKAKEAKKKPEPTPEELAAKALKKEAKRQAKEAKSEPTPEEIAAKALKKEAKRQAKAAKPAPTPEELAAKALKKEAKRQAKEAKSEPTAEEIAAKALKKEAKRQAKAAKPAPTPEELAAKALKKEAKRQARGEEGDGEPRPLRILFSGIDEASPLRRAIEDAFRASGTEIETSEGRSDIAVYAFDGVDADAISRRAAAIKEEKARLRIFLERASGESDEANRAIVRLAYACGGSLVSVSATLKRFGLENTLADGEPNEFGRKLIAQSVIGVGAARLPGANFVPPPATSPDDVAQARALAPLEFLPQLRWSVPSTPKSIWVHISKEDVEGLADSRIELPGEGTEPLALPIDWSADFGEGRAAQYVKSLDFLTGALAYWYAKANGQSSENISAIDAALKQRSMTPNVVLARSAQVIAEFIAKQPRATAPDAWVEGALTRRARVFLLYVLCCKTALKKKIKFNEASCANVYGALLDTLEALRADDFYEPCSADGLELDCLLIGIALALRGSAYGASLLAASLGRLKRLQVEPGLSADGVWRGDYAAHTAVLSALTALIGDFPTGDAALIEPIAAAAKKMTVFAEAMLKSNGHPPAIDGSRQRSYAERLSGMRRIIARSAGKQSGAKGPLRTRITDTYVFRDAQYFISHSAQTVGADDSLAVLHAASPAVARQDPGGVTLVFAQGESNLLVRTGPAEKIRAKQDQTPLYDPSLRNSYRVNGEDNAPPVEGGTKAARIVKSWRGTGWAAAKSVEDIYANATIGRTAIHLKTVHALVVIDELATVDAAEAEFEQFWRVAPEFAPPTALAQPLCFASAGKGGMQVAMSGESVLDIETGETGSCLRRRVKLSKDVVATIFQWTDGPAPASIAVERQASDGWAIRAAGKGFSLVASLQGSELACETAAA